MPQSVYARTAARGFPVQDISGQTGVGHLQDKTRLPARAGLADASWAQAEAMQHANYAPATMPPPEEYVLGLSFWGLPAGKNPDTTPHGVEYPAHQIGDVGPGVQGVDIIPVPKGLDAYPQGPYHDAPLIDPGLATMDPIQGQESTRAQAYLDADATRAGDIDTSEEVLYPNYPDVDYVGFQGVMKQDHVGPEESNDQPAQDRVTGQMRGNANAGLDSMQGYGGGGKGPGGTNAIRVVYDQRNYPGTFYAADAFTQAGEVPHIDAETAQFIQNQPGQATWTGDMWSAPLTKTHAQQITPADVPLQGPAVSAGSGVQPMWGG